MAMKCEENTKYVWLRLTEDILIESFTLINKEFYSSNFKAFELYGC